MSRIRTKNISNSGIDIHEEWFRYESQLAFSSDVSVTSQKTFEGMVDEEVPSFHALQKRGRLFFNPMVHEKLSYYGTPSGIEASAWLGTRHDHGTLVPRSGPPGFAQTIVLGDAGSSYLNAINYFNGLGTGPVDLAITKAWSKIDQTLLPLLVTLGEGKETLATVCSVLRRLIAFYKFLHSGKQSQLELALRGNKRAIAKVNRTIKGLSPSSWWMEARYAIRPLYYELGAALDLLNAELKRMERLTCRGVETVVSTTTGTAIIAYDASTWLEYQSLVQTVRRCRAGVLFGFLNNSVSFVELLGLDRPVGALLELTRLSFVLDWVVNISDLIASWEANASVTVHGCWTMDEVLLRTNLHSPTCGNTWGKHGYTNVEMNPTNASSSWTLEKWMVYRNPAAKRPLTPSVKIRLNWAKVLDLAIILKQLVLSAKR